MTALGFLNVNKPSGLTSHDVVARVRRGLKIKKVGHAGTLDPLATGVLVVCVGAATRLSEYVMHGTKHYRAQVQLGVTTTTYDAEGEIVAQRDPSGITRSNVEQALTGFQGVIEQIPPMHSAIKQDGRKLYELARAGQVVERPPRTIEISALTIHDWSPPQVVIDVTCSAGTYIRSLAFDLGEALGVGAHLAGLTRTASGSFTLANAVELDALLVDPHWEKSLIRPVEALQPMPVIQFDAEAIERLIHGQVVSAADAVGGVLAQAYSAEMQFIAIVEGNGGGWIPRKVFAQEVGL